MKILNKLVECKQWIIRIVSKRSTTKDGHQMLIEVLKNNYVQNTIPKEIINKIKDEIKNPESWKDTKNVC